MSKTYDLTICYTVTYTKTFKVDAPGHEDLHAAFLDNKVYEIVSESNCSEWEYAGDPEIDFEYEQA